MCELKGEITKAAPARLLEEIFKIGRSGDSAGAWKILLDSGVLEHWMPDIASVLQQDAPAGDESATSPRELFLGRCARMDADPDGREMLGNTMFLVPLYHVLLRDHLQPKPVNERRLMGLLEDIARPFALAFRVARRDSTWARHICWAQRRMEGWGRDSVPAHRFVRFDYFQAALTYLAWRAEAGEVPRQLVEGWAERAVAESHKPVISTCAPPRRRSGRRSGSRDRGRRR
jgi:poly(A) polymerase